MTPWDAAGYARAIVKNLERLHAFPQSWTGSQIDELAESAAIVEPLTAAYAAGQRDQQATDLALMPGFADAARRAATLAAQLTALEGAVHRAAERAGVDRYHASDGSERPAEAIVGELVAAGRRQAAAVVRGRACSTNAKSPRPSNCVGCLHDACTALRQVAAAIEATCTGS